MKNCLVPAINAEGFEVNNPWCDVDAIHERIQEIHSLNDPTKETEQLRELNEQVASNNKEFIDHAQLVLAILDGSDVDSGVAAEIGYAFALGRKILGYRSDSRITGDNTAATVNIQVEYFITKSGGYILKPSTTNTCNALIELCQALQKLRRDLLQETKKI